MRLSKKDCLLISEMNEAYASIYKRLVMSPSPETGDFLKKLKLNKVLAKNFEEQKRWFSKSELDYKKSARFFISEFENLSYEDLHKEISKILLNL